MIGIYHNADLDGFTSGAIIKMKFPNARMIGYDYGQQFELKDTGQLIIMADVSFPMEQMKQLVYSANGQLTWIDHHISAIKSYTEFVGDGKPFCNAVLDIGISACEGTWKYLYPETPIPLAVKLLGEYDTWRNSNKRHWKEEVLPFQFGMRLNCNSIDNFPIEVFENENLVSKIIDEGKTVLKYQASVNELLCKKAAFEFEFEGLRAIGLNAAHCNQETFTNIYDEAKYDIVVPFYFNGKSWSIYLFSTKETIDCSAIATSKGGGGHQKAAGFQVKNIHEVFPFMNDISIFNQYSYN